LGSDDGGKRRSVRVKITGTAMVMRDVHWRVGTARDTKGQTEIARVLEWEEPPEEIEFHSTSRTPTYSGGDPGPEVRELAEIADWFEERGIVILFAGHGPTFTGPIREVPPPSIWNANLLDLEKDELVNRFEARSRLEAARAARDWWRSTRERGDAHAITLTPATETDTALPLSATGGHAGASGGQADLRVGPDEAARLRQLQTRYTVVITRPDAEESGSMWMIELFDKTEALVGIAVQPTLDEALLTIVEDMLPPDDEK
jgi:hypothetical protein